jgi:hypothetical protein
MVKIREFLLTDADVNFITKYIVDFDISGKIYHKNAHFFLKLTKVEQDNLVNLLDDLFASVGLNEDYEPNEVGRQVEHLIDIFNPYKNSANKVKQ